MNKFQKFVFNNSSIRSVKIDNTIWFLAKDVTKALNQTNIHRTVLLNVSKHNIKTIKWRNMSNLFKTKLWGKNDYSNKALINEPGLYSVAFHSQTPFYNWVINRVLPSINHHNNYATLKNTEEYLNNTDMILTIPIRYKNTQKKAKKSKFPQKNTKAKNNFYKNNKSSRGTILVSDMAKLLKKNGINTGQKRLFKWLRNNHYLSSRHGLDWNTPTQKSLDMNILTFKEESKNPFDDSKFIFKTPLITGKGQQYFYKKFKNILTKKH